jgi:hypothetical protein
VPSSPPRSRPADSISGNDEVGEPVSGDVSNMEPASNLHQTQDASILSSPSTPVQCPDA